MLFKKSDRN